jgi:hypothetical protein
MKADFSTASTQFVRITHPFHPVSGRQLICVGERFNCHGKRLLLQLDDGTVWSVPPQWTDIVCPDPEVVMGRGRALFRVADLIALARLVKRLGDRRRDAAEECNDDYAADVKPLMPHKRLSK